MPFRYTCVDHADWSDTSVEGAIAHVTTAHPGRTVGRMIDTGDVRRTFTDQATAQGHRRLRVFLCPRCYDPVETTDPAQEDCGAH